MKALVCTLGSIVCFSATAYASESKLWDLLQGRPEAIEHFTDQLSEAELLDGEHGMRNDARSWAIQWAVTTTFRGEPVGILILGPQVNVQPGNNSIGIFVVDQTLTPMAWTKAGGEQIFAFAMYDYTRHRLVTYSRSNYHGGTVIQTLKVTPNEISIMETASEDNFSLGRSHVFPLARRVEEEPNNEE